MKKLEELEELIMNKLISEGYERGVGHWGFTVEINSKWKQKELKIIFHEDGRNFEAYRVLKDNFNDMIDEAINKVTKI